MKKYCFLLLTIFIIFISTTGCIRLHTKITLHGDGGGKWEYIIALNDKLLEMDHNIKNSFEEIKRNAEKAEFTVNDYQEEGYTGVVIHRYFTNIEDVNAKNFMADLAQGDKSLTEEDFDSLFKPDIKVKKGFIYNTYNIFIEIEPGIIDNTDIQMFKQTFDLKFILESPVKIKNHNALTVNNNEKTLTWELKPDQISTVDIELKLLNVWSVLILTLIILVLISTILLFILKHKNKYILKKTEEI